MAGCGDAAVALSLRAHTAAGAIACPAAPQPASYVALLVTAGAARRPPLHRREEAAAALPPLDMFAAPHVSMTTRACLTLLPVCLPPLKPNPPARRRTSAAILFVVGTTSRHSESFKSDQNQAPSQHHASAVTDRGNQAGRQVRKHLNSKQKESRPPSWQQEATKQPPGRVAGKGVEF